MISLKRSLPNVNHRAYRRLSGLVGFRRPLESGLDRPRLSPGAACLGPAYGLARWEHCYTLSNLPYFISPANINVLPLNYSNIM